MKRIILKGEVQIEVPQTRLEKFERLIGFRPGWSVHRTLINEKVWIRFEWSEND